MIYKQIFLVEVFLGFLKDKINAKTGVIASVLCFTFLFPTVVFADKIELRPSGYRDFGNKTKNSKNAYDSIGDYKKTFSLTQTDSSKSPSLIFYFANQSNPSFEIKKISLKIDFETQKHKDDQWRIRYSLNRGRSWKNLEDYSSSNFSLRTDEAILPINQKISDLVLRVDSKLRRTRDKGTLKIYDAYVEIEYESGSGSGIKEVVFLDNQNNSLETLPIEFPSKEFSFSSQKSNFKLNDSGFKIKISNQSEVSEWSVALSAKNGAEDYWKTLEGEKMQFNGKNEDEGKFFVDLSEVDIALNGCDKKGLNIGESSFFKKGEVDSITLFQADSEATPFCEWIFTGLNFIQEIPPSQPAGDYSIEMILTIV